MPSSRKKHIEPTKYLAMWDCLGLECLINISEIEGKRAWSTLKEEKLPDYPPLHMMEFRAKANPQRNYEIYLFTSYDISEEDIRRLFEDSPQVMADTIRRQGVPVYSNRLNENDRKII